MVWIAFRHVLCSRILHYATLFQEGKFAQTVSRKLSMYMLIATVIGARLGHVLFYEPASYLADPLDILKIWEGGLASHGAAIGILSCLYFFACSESD